MGINCAAVGIILSLALSALADEPRSAAEYVSRGMRQFQENKITESLRDFDKAIELEPQTAPYLWQRGISDYYAGKFQEGRRQFESHKAVNPHDVENAAWHFLCAARIDGIETARKSLMKIETSRDTRVPMAEVYEFFTGRGSEAAVMKAAKVEGSEKSAMYAHLYLGLYYEAAGDVDKARDHIRKAAAARLQKNYMHDVAKIHLLQRKWKKP
jgi:lipoprotein NlpI